MRVCAGARRMDLKLEVEDRHGPVSGMNTGINSIQR